MTFIHLLKNSFTRTFVILLSIFISVVILLGIAYLFYTRDKILPNTFIAGTSVSLLTQKEASSYLETKTDVPNSITLIYKDRTFEISLDKINFYYNFAGSANLAYQLPRNGTMFNKITRSFVSVVTKSNTPLVYTLDNSLLSEHLLIIADEITSDPIFPSVNLTGDAITVNPGQKGYEIDTINLQETILKNLSFNKFTPVIMVSKEIDPTLTENQIDLYKKRAEGLLRKTLVLTFEKERFTYQRESLLEMLDPKGALKNETLTKIADDLKVKIDREPQNPVFVFEDKLVKEFSPAKDGIALNNNELTTAIASVITTMEINDVLETEVQIPVTKVAPSTTTDKVNNLGVKELIGRGKSKFAGSIASRIHNVGIASKRFHGVLVAPGDAFSFNENLGDVSTYTGYKQAYIIRDGKTVLGDGGGVCQVSTTLFRAALAAGLPITERRSHSYRVTYYEQGSAPGIDATVYAPTTDFKFTNDTPGHILIQVRFDASNLTLDFELYGTSDGREVELTKPVITSQTPPPEDLYQDDPTLPTGQIKQIDWAAWGAKVSFDYKVTRNGAVIQEKTFYSNYRPWQAKFLRGTGSAI